MIFSQLYTGCFLAVALASFFYRIFIPQQIFHSPLKVLGLFRVTIFSLIVIETFRDDPISLLNFPAEFFDFQSVVNWSSEEVWLLFRDPIILTVLTYTCIIGGLLATFGVFTRSAGTLCLVSFFILGVLLRAASHNYHSGLILLYLGAVLIFSPCSKTFLLSTLFNQKKISADQESEVLAHNYIYLLLTFFALVYASAGMSKVLHGGLFWWDGENMRAHVLSSLVNRFNPTADFAEYVFSIPYLLLSLLGVATVVIEIFFPLYNKFKSIQYIAPIAALGMHIGIYALQGILFLDLICINVLLIALNFLYSEKNIAYFNKSYWLPFIVAIAVSIQTFFVVTSTEKYPFSPFWMYSMVRNLNESTYLLIECKNKDNQNITLNLLSEFPFLHEKEIDLYERFLNPKIHSVSERFLKERVKRLPENSTPVILKLQKRKWIHEERNTLIPEKEEEVKFIL